MSVVVPKEAPWPRYKGRPIATVEKLGLALGCPPKSLLMLVKNSDSMYREVHKEKKDGTMRVVYDAHPLLKKVHHKIVNTLFYNVAYPKYLHGGIRDRAFPRDQVSNAKQHATAKTLILEDVENFFPSLSGYWVFQMWLKLFKFPPEVARVLTALTVRYDFLPQGAKTSSYIANLIFWDCEYLLVDKIANLGLRYTRFADDITVSAKSELPEKDILKIRSWVYEMLASRQCLPKREKSELIQKGNSMSVTGLVANGITPSIARSERRKIRAKVKQLEIAFCREGASAWLVSEIASAKGRVARMTRLGHQSAPALRERLDRLEGFVSVTSPDT